MGSTDPTLQALQAKQSMNAAVVQMKREQVANLENPDSSMEFSTDAANFISTAGSIGMTLALIPIFIPSAFKTIKNVVPKTEAQKIVGGLIDNAAKLSEKGLDDTAFKNFIDSTREQYGSSFAGHLKNSIKLQQEKQHFEKLYRGPTKDEFSKFITDVKASDFNNTKSVSADDIRYWKGRIEGSKADIEKNSQSMLDTVQDSAEGKKLDVRNSPFLTKVQDKFPGGITGAVIAGVALLSVAAVIAGRSQREHTRNLAAAQMKAEINAMEVSYAQEMSAMQRHEEVMDAVANGGSNVNQSNAPAVATLSIEQSQNQNNARVSGELDALLSPPETTIPSAAKGEERSTERVEAQLDKLLS